jgi:predicted nucleic acid-binding protein
LTEGDVFVTTNFVLAEAITLIRYHLHQAAAVRFHQLVRQMVDGGLIEVVRISEEHEANAWAIFEKYSDQKFSYTDCTSFAVMRELNLAHVFTGDHHFSVLGFTLIS